MEMITLFQSAQSARLTRIVISLGAILFGIATVKEGGSVLFGDGEARAAAGNYVPFILWFNFLAGFFYVVTGVGILRSRSWARQVARAVAGATLIFFVLLAIHIATERPYEMRTVFAMAIRSGVWCGIAFFLNSKRQSRSLLVGILAFLALGAHPSTLFASDSELTKMPETLTVGGTSLRLNGQTVHTVSFLRIKAFAVGLYLETGSDNYMQLVTSAQVKHIRARFFRSVGKERLARTWSKQIRESCQSHCNELATVTERLEQAFEDVSSGDLLEFTVYPNRLSISVRGQLKDSIPSAAMAAAMLAAWIGPRPLDEEVRSELLGNRTENLR